MKNLPPFDLTLNTIRATGWIRTIMVRFWRPTSTTYALKHFVFEKGERKLNLKPSPFTYLT
jgi:hypothetical protein